MPFAILKQITLITLIFILSACEQPKLDRGNFNQIASVVLTSFQSGDVQTLNSLTHSETGLWTVYRVGLFDTFSNSKKLDLDKLLSNEEELSNQKPVLELSYGQLPNFDCETHTWDKQGFFADTVRTVNLLSKTAELRNKYTGDEFTSKEISNLKSIDNKSKKVIFTASNSNELVFYLTKIQGNWYLTILDKVSSDCSA